MKFLTTLRIHDGIIRNLVRGATVSNVVKKAKKRLRRVFGEYVKVPTSFGHCIGLRAQETAFSLTTDNMNQLTEDMVLFVYTTIEDVPLKTPDRTSSAPINQLQKYALILGDTVHVTTNPGRILSSTVPADLSEVIYDINYEDEQTSDEEAELADFDNVGRIRGHSARLLLRKDSDEAHAADVLRAQQHQIKLHEEKAEEAKRSLADAEYQKQAQDPEVERFTSYKTPMDLPNKCIAGKQQIVVDKPNESVLVPMMGTVAPFHFDTIKSVSVSEEGEKTSLHFNLYAPCRKLGKDCPARMVKQLRRTQK